VLNGSGCEQQIGKEVSWSQSCGLMLHSDVVGYQCFIGPPSTLHPEVYLETTRSSETGITTQRTATQIFITMKTSSPALGLNLANFNSVTVFMTMLLKNTVFQHNSQVYHCSDSS